MGPLCSNLLVTKLRHRGEETVAITLPKTLERIAADWVAGGVLVLLRPGLISPCARQRNRAQVRTGKGSRSMPRDLEHGTHARLMRNDEITPPPRSGPRR